MEARSSIPWSCLTKRHVISQLLLVPLNHLGGFSTLIRSRVLIRRIRPCAWLAPHTPDLLANMWVTKPPTYVFGNLPLVGGQW